MVKKKKSVKKKKGRTSKTVKSRTTSKRKVNKPIAKKSVPKRKRVFNTMLTFFFLSIILNILAGNVTDGSMSKLFWYFGFLTGTITLALLIALLVLIFRKIA